MTSHAQMGFNDVTLGFNDVTMFTQNCQNRRKQAWLYISEAMAGYAHGEVLKVYSLTI